MTAQPTQPTPFTIEPTSKPQAQHAVLHTVTILENTQNPKNPRYQKHVTDVETVDRAEAAPKPAPKRPVVRSITAVSMLSEAEVAELRLLDAKAEGVDESAAIRKTTLGCDRLGNRYWWLGSGGAESSMPVGAIFVERVAPPAAASLSPPPQASTSVGTDVSLAHITAEVPAPAGLDGNGNSNSLPHEPQPSEAAPTGWGWVYHTVPQVNALLQWLNPGGVREMALRVEVLRCRDLLARSQGVPIVPAKGKGSTAAATAKTPNALPGAETAVVAEVTVLPPAPPAAMLQQTGFTRSTSRAALAAEHSAALAAAAAPAASEVSVAAAEPQPPAAAAVAEDSNGDDEVPAPTPALRFTRSQLSEEKDIAQMTSATASSSAAAATAAAPVAAPAAAEAVAAEPEPCASLRKTLLELFESLHVNAFRNFWGSEERKALWLVMMSDAATPPQLSAAITLFEGMLKDAWLRPHWRLCGLPAQHPAMAGTWAAVAYRLGVLQSAVKDKVSWSGR